MHQPTNFDAVIIGAGPAGSAAAILLARAGWAVALVERQPFPRRKVCGECIAASNMPLLAALGLGGALQAGAGFELRQVTLLRGASEFSARLHPAVDTDHPWGLALDRQRLDALLLDKARESGAEVMQPWSLQAMAGQAGAWQCEVRSASTGQSLVLHSVVLIDAHGSWEPLPVQRKYATRHIVRRAPHQPSDLFGFKAHFTGASHRPGEISLLALDGGYGSMVVADGGVTTVACCIRRDRLDVLRRDSGGQSAGAAVQDWLQRECAGVQRVLATGTRDGSWLSVGPIRPGVRVGEHNKLFRIGNAAGEAHPILGEGISMALQSAALLCSNLLGRRLLSSAAEDLDQADVLRAYVADWKRAFTPRRHMAAAFAHSAMRPRVSGVLMSLVRACPGLLTQSGRWGGKVELPLLSSPPATLRWLTPGLTREGTALPARPFAASVLDRPRPVSPRPAHGNEPPP